MEGSTDLCAAAPDSPELVEQPRVGETVTLGEIIDRIMARLIANEGKGGVGAGPCQADDASAEKRTTESGHLAALREEEGDGQQREGAACLGGFPFRAGPPHQAKCKADPNAAEAEERQVTIANNPHAKSPSQSGHELSLAGVEGVGPDAGDERPGHSSATREQPRIELVVM